MSIRKRAAGVAAGFAFLVLLSSSAVARTKPRFEVAVRVPQILSIGAELRCATDGDEPERVWCTERLRPYVVGGYVQYPFSGTSTGFRVATLEFGERWYYGGVPDRFYLGLGLGYRYIRANANLSAFRIQGENVSTGALVGLHSFYLSPTLGVSWALGERSRFGLEVGVQWAFAGVGSVNMVNDTTGEDSSNSTRLSVINGSYVNHIARTLVPHLALARFTFEF